LKQKKNKFNHHPILVDFGSNDHMDFYPEELERAGFPFKPKIKKPLNYNEPLPKVGDLFTIEEWISDVKNELLIDYDGYGHYATETMMDRSVIVRPSDVKRGNIDKSATHIMWFNR
jgi:hypothetical protein